ncbi:MAG TPA: hypothetical protein DEA79_12465 [Cyanobacteria bacterium UBA11153]|nr:hypothetical protein [Cyanobacteria bacterium UBA11153]
MIDFLVWSNFIPIILTVILLVTLVFGAIAMIAASISDSRAKKTLSSQRRIRWLEYQLSLFESEKREFLFDKEIDAIEVVTTSQEIINKLEIAEFTPHKISSIKKEYEYLIENEEILELTLNLALDFFLSPFSIMEKNSSLKLQDSRLFGSDIKIIESTLIVSVSVVEKISKLLDLEKTQIKTTNNLFQKIKLNERQTRTMTKLLS